MYTYKAKAISVYDGDTVTLVVDLGFKISTEVKLRLEGIDTPELRRARDARDHLRRRLDEGAVRVQTTKKGKYGRWLGVLWVGDSTESINDELVRLGHAKPYSGGKRG